MLGDPSARGGAGAGSSVGHLSGAGSSDPDIAPKQVKQVYCAAGNSNECD